MRPPSARRPRLAGSALPVAVGLAILAFSPAVRAQHAGAHGGHDAHETGGPGHPDHGGNHDATMRHRFEDAAAWAARFEDPSRDEWQHPEEVVKAPVTRPDLLIADIGSATGYFPVRFAKAAPQGMVYGADIEPDMVRYLNDRARAESLPNLVSVLAGTDGPHLPRPVDLVFLCNTIHHLDDRVEYFRRLKADLRPGGRVAVVDYTLESKMGPPHKLDSKVVEEEMKEAGYEVVARPDFLPEQYLLVFSPAN
ncbi:MAG: methyltransferase domain-containing protein [Gemmatimonadetes bacterium]|nr:methyltransferase domain-containing protein [Gemmatimonadota bacterium]